MHISATIKYLLYCMHISATIKYLLISYPARGIIIYAHKKTLLQSGTA